MKIKKIQYTHNRVLLSEVLPYETPIFFSNRRFYRFANYYGLCIEQNTIIPKKHLGEGIEDFIKLWNIDGRNVKPFRYLVNHKTKKWDKLEEDYKDGSLDDTDYRGFRELSIIHPYYQIAFTEFYNKYQDTIIYYCNRSKYSIRYPYKKAHLIKSGKDNISSILDESKDDDNYETLKHYFTYKNYRNINSFFDDYTYLRAEKKFQYLLKLDMKECFDSIKISTLNKAIFGNDEFDFTNSFSAEFAKLMYQVKEDHNDKGIIIGPEFSRLFAEIIFQTIDKSIELQLREKNIVINNDYECYRYVDDIYLFFNKYETNIAFKDTLVKKLSEYGLSLNEKKEQIIERPLLDNKTVAKQKIQTWVKYVFENKLKTFFADDIDNLIINKISPYSVNQKEAIREFKCIIKETNVEYRDIMTFTASRISNMLDKMLKSYDELYRKYVEAQYNDIIDSDGVKLKELFQKQISRFLDELILCIFFLISSDFRVSTTLSFVSIMDRIISFVNGAYLVEGKRLYRFQKEQKTTLFKTIHDEVVFLLKNRYISDNQQVELSYIVALDSKLKNGFSISISLFDKILSNIKYPNYFTFGTILTYIENDKNYEALKERIVSILFSRLERYVANSENSTEDVLLISDCLCCPYIVDSDKNKMLKLLGYNNDCEVKRILTFVNRQKNLFIKWENINLRKELLAKKSKEVY